MLSEARNSCGWYDTPGDPSLCERRPTPQPTCPSSERGKLSYVGPGDEVRRGTGDYESGAVWSRDRAADGCSSAGRTRQGRLRADAECARASTKTLTCSLWMAAL